MANKEDLAILLQAIDAGDVGIWNRFREGSTSGIDLSNAVLMGILSGKKKKQNDARRRAAVKGLHTQLSNINFSGIDLSRANLAFVDLSGANLTGASLRRANLRSANLSRADLTLLISMKRTFIMRIFLIAF
jgi:uncharacterized protein YjbI with pentapeptide repeats